jgi:glutamyl-tRNA synthetase
MGERFSLAEAAAVFGFERVNKAGARFDWDKLNWLNGQVLREQGAETLREQLLPLWAARGWAMEPGEAAANPCHADPAWQLELIELLAPSLTLLADGVEQAQPFFTCPPLNAAAEAQLAAEGARPALAALAASLAAHDPAEPLSADQAQALLGEAATSAGVKKGVLMKSLRAALLGSLQGPDLLTTWLLLQRSGDALARIQRCL